MSPTSYQAAPPRIWIIAAVLLRVKSRHVAAMLYKFAMRIRILTVLLLVFNSLAHTQVVLQSLPPDTPQTCSARSATMMKWLKDWPNLSRYQRADLDLGASKGGE